MASIANSGKGGCFGEECEKISDSCHRKISKGGTCRHGPSSAQTASTTLNLNALESHLWEAANILRGSPLGRTDWRSYILPLLFFKRICDVWGEEAAARELKDFPEAHRFQAMFLNS